MANNDETFVLVEFDKSDGDTKMMRVVRTYYSASRAEQDRELLAMACPSCDFSVVPVEHIDN